MPTDRQQADPAASATRLVFADGEWLVSDLRLDEVEALLEAHRVIPAARQGRRVIVNPVHILYAEAWERRE